MYQKVKLVQTGTNVTSEVAIPTYLTVDGKQGWSIIGVDLNVAGLGTIVPATASSQILVELNTETGIQNWEDPDNVIYHQLQFRGIAASTSAIQLFGDASIRLLEPRVTVQPNLYLNISSNGLTAVATVYMSVVYEVVKLTDMEVMRMLQGGA